MLLQKNIFFFGIHFSENHCTFPKGKRFPREGGEKHGGRNKAMDQYRKQKKSCSNLLRKRGQQMRKLVNHFGC